MNAVELIIYNSGNLHEDIIAIVKNDYTATKVALQCSAFLDDTRADKLVFLFYLHVPMHVYMHNKHIHIQRFI